MDSRYRHAHPLQYLLHMLGLIVGLLTIGVGGLFGMSLGTIILVAAGAFGLAALASPGGRILLLLSALFGIAVR